MSFTQARQGIIFGPTMVVLLCKTFEMWNLNLVPRFFEGTERRTNLRECGW